MENNQCCIEKLFSVLESNYSLEGALVTYINDLVARATRQPNEDLNSLRELYAKYLQYLDPHDLVKKNLDQENNLAPLIKILHVLDSNLLEKSGHIKFNSCFRVKSLFSYVDKIKRMGPQKAKSELQDLLAFRFTLKNVTPKQNVIDCYLFLEEIVSILGTLDFKPIPAKPTKNTKDFDIKNFRADDIYVPSEYEIPRCENIENFKDYILHPKTNGYQGLHCIFYSASFDTFLEVQVKTLLMLDHSENFDANHDKYKSLMKSSASDESLNYKRFNNIEGFHSRDGRHFIDTVGLVNPRIYIAQNF